jgi:hypothetical protein
MSKPRIGVLLALGESEGNKFELVSETRRIPARPWVKKADEDFLIDRRDVKKTKSMGGGVIPGCVGIPGDVSIGEYIKYHHGDSFDVDYIEPKDITVERLKSNDINFLLIYDLLEAFHTDRKGEVFRKFKEALGTVGNIYPNLEYQEFINSKLLYYNHFKEKKIPIAPTITVSKQEWSVRVAQLAADKSVVSPESAVALEIIAEIQRQGFEKFIAKPVYGQEAKGVGIFEMSTLDKVKFTRFLRKNFATYPGLIIQDFIKDFGDTKESPELRMYFVGRQYQFTAMATKKGTYTLKQDGVGGSLTLPSHIDIKVLKALAQRAMDNMPPIVMNNNSRGAGGSQNPAAIMPKLLTRVDMGCVRNGRFDPWINEVEFVPSLYIEDHRCPIDGLLGEQMVRITRQFISGKGRLSANRAARKGVVLRGKKKAAPWAGSLRRSKLQSSTDPFSMPRSMKSKRTLASLTSLLSVPWLPSHARGRNKMGLSKSRCCGITQQVSKRHVLKKAKLGSR